MGYMNFKDPSLEKLFKVLKWTRNNTLQLFKQAQKYKVLSYTSHSIKKTKHTFQPIIFQFQCVLTTTDAYFRKLTKHSNTKYGILIANEKIVSKKDIAEEDIESVLKKQLADLEKLLRDVNDKKGQDYLVYLLRIINHEYLHQGELILMFREAGAEFPERFQKAWAL